MNRVTLPFLVKSKHVVVTTLNFIIATQTTFTNTILGTFTSTSLSTFITYILLPLATNTLFNRRDIHATSGMTGLVLASGLRRTALTTLESNSVSIFRRSNLPTLTTLASICGAIFVFIVGTGRNHCPRVPCVHRGPVDVSQRGGNLIVAFVSLWIFHIASMCYDLHDSDDQLIFLRA